VTILDTHVLVWLVSNPEKISEKARKLIDQEVKKSELLVSSISVWEIYMLVKKGRLKLSLDVDTWFEKIEQLSFLQFIPIDNKIAAKSVMLPEPLHSDPADRMIAATAREYAAVLITSDKRLLTYPSVQSIW